MARYEDVMNSFMESQGGRPEGAPRMPQAPGAPMSPSQPEPPTTPGLNMGVNGRPVGSGGPPMPMAPPQPEVSEPAAPPKSEAEAGNLESQKNVNPGPQIMLLNRLPKAGELYDFPPGVTVRTPYGDLDQEGNIATSPEYAEKHKEAIARARGKFGPSPWAGMAGAPEMDMAVGKSWFNPFNSQFGRVE